MAANVETLGTLERRVSMSLPVNEIDKQVDERLKKLARNVRMPGFRPGKVPMKLVTQTYGPQVRSEVISDAIQKGFNETVNEQKLRVAGYPRIEPAQGATLDDDADGLLLGHADASIGRTALGTQLLHTSNPRVRL